MFNGSNDGGSSFRIDKLERGGYRFALAVGGTDVLFSVHFASRADAVAAMDVARERLVAGNIACGVPRGRGRAHFMILSPRATLLARSVDFDSEQAMQSVIEKCARAARTACTLGQDTRPADAAGSERPARR